MRTIQFKKTLMGGLVAASLAICSWSATAATTPMTVTFTGTVLDNTCGTPTVSGGGTVAFGNIARTDFNGVGSTGATRDFDITFAGCGNDTSGVYVWFDGTTSNTIHALDNPVAEGNATGVGVQVYANSTQLESDNPTATAALSLAPTGGTVQLQARVVQTTSTAPSLGALNTQGTLYVQYQ